MARPSVSKILFFANFLGAEKKTFSEMQKRRFEAVEDDKEDDRRDSIDDLLLRELTRREHAVKGEYVMSLI